MLPFATQIDGHAKESENSRDRARQWAFGTWNFEHLSADSGRKLLIIKGDKDMHVGIKFNSKAPLPPFSLRSPIRFKARTCISTHPHLHIKSSTHSDLLCNFNLSLYYIFICSLNLAYYISACAIFTSGLHSSKPSVSSLWQHHWSWQHEPFRRNLFLPRLHVNYASTPLSTPTWQESDSIRVPRPEYCDTLTNFCPSHRWQRLGPLDQLVWWSCRATFTGI